MAEIKLVNAVKEYNKGKVRAVNDISFVCHDKEFIALLGPSGAGKTSTLKMIAGSEDLTEGKLFINGEDYTNIPSQKRNVSMVFESYALYPHMTVRENLAFPLQAPIRKKTMTKEEMNAKVEEWANIVGLGELLDRKPSQLSGGQRQRVSLARALVRAPELNVILMDEPIAHLDAKLRYGMRAELKRLHKDLGATIIYVTHDYAEAMAMADRIIVINNGEIMQIGTPREIYDSPASEFVASTCGDPPMNFINGDLTDGIFTYEDMKINLGEPDISGNIDLGVRPTDFRIEKEKAGDYFFYGVLQNVLPTGMKQIMEVNVGGRMILAKCQRDHSYNKGDTVYLYPDNAKVSLFDAETKNSLNRG